MLRDVGRRTLERLLDREDLPADARRVAELRVAGARASAKKIDALLARAGDDGRVRGGFKYHAASTGRWSGEGAQPQNLKRPIIEDVDAAIEAVMTGNVEILRGLHPQGVLAVIGDLARSMIAAAPGCVLIVADFASIETRVLAFLAGETW